MLGAFGRSHLEILDLPVANGGFNRRVAWRMQFAFNVPALRSCGGDQYLLAVGLQKHDRLRERSPH